jgi:hypothetical protein
MVEYYLELSAQRMSWICPCQPDFPLTFIVWSNRDEVSSRLTRFLSPLLSSLIDVDTGNVLSLHLTARATSTAFWSLHVAVRWRSPQSPCVSMRISHGNPATEFGSRSPNFQGYSNFTTVSHLQLEKQDLQKSKSLPEHSLWSRHSLEMAILRPAAMSRQIHLAPMYVTDSGQSRSCTVHSQVPD